MQQAHNRADQPQRPQRPHLELVESSPMSIAEFLPEPITPFGGYEQHVPLPPGHVVEVTRRSAEGIRFGWAPAIAALVRRGLVEDQVAVDVLFMADGQLRVEPFENAPTVKYDPDFDEQWQSMRAFRDGLVDVIGALVGALHNDIGVEIFGIAQAIGNFQEDVCTEIVGATQAIDARGARTPFVPRRWGPPPPHEALAQALNTVTAHPTLATLTDEAWRLRDHVADGLLDKADVTRQLVEAANTGDVAAATKAVIGALNSRRSRR